jgi:hypothetical protein
MSRVTVVTGATSKVRRLVMAQLWQTGRGVKAGKPVEVADHGVAPTLLAAGPAAPTSCWTSVPRMCVGLLA